MFKKGFTLAEVLITLAIIGIVAALTIPSVISNYQQQEFKTGLKKAVSVLNEAIQTNIAQEGETPYENQDLFNYLQRHMSVLKTQNAYNCYDENGKFTSDLHSNGFCGSGTDDSIIQNRVFYTADGMRFEIISIIAYNLNYGPLLLHETGLDANSKKTGVYRTSYGPVYNDAQVLNAFCGSYGLASNPNNTINTPCVITVDVNGDKKPNTLEGTTSIHSGNPLNSTREYTYPSPADKKLQDVFNILITDEKAIPFGVVAQRAMYSK